MWCSDLARWPPGGSPARLAMASTLPRSSGVSETRALYAVEVNRPMKRCSPITSPCVVVALDADVVGVAGPVHGGAGVGLGDHQHRQRRAWPAACACGGKAAKLADSFSSAVSRSRPRPLPGTSRSAGSPCSLHQVVLAVAQQRQVVVGQPLQEGPAFGHLGCGHGGRRVLQLGDRVVQPGQHRLPVLHGGAHVGQHPLDAGRQRVALLRVHQPVDLRYASTIRAAPAGDFARGRRSRRSRPLASRSHRVDRVHDQVQRQALAVDLQGGGVHQERHVVVDDLDHGVARAPAVLAGVGLKMRTLGRARLAHLAQLQVRQQRAQQVLGRALGQVLRHRAAGNIRRAMAATSLRRAGSSRAAASASTASTRLCTAWVEAFMGNPFVLVLACRRASRTGRCRQYSRRRPGEAQMPDSAGSMRGTHARRDHGICARSVHRDGQEQRLQVAEEIEAALGGPARGPGRARSGPCARPPAAAARWRVSGRPVRSVNCASAKPSRRRSALSMNSNGRSARATSSSCASGLPGQRVVHVEPGLAKAHLPHDAVRETELAVRARADAQVVAELPVVQVVPAAVARAWHRPRLRSGPCRRRRSSR